MSNKIKKVEGWYLPSKEKHFVSYLLQNQNNENKGEYQKEQRAKSFSYVENYHLAIDIGACVGFWSKDLCKNFERVICFEPYRDSAECLQKNLKSFNNYKLYQIGLSNVNGTQKLMYSENGIGSNSISDKNMRENIFVPIPTKKLDDFNFRRISYIKMDVQFHELKVLEGAKKTLKTNSPVLCIECARRNDKELNYVNAIINFLKSLDYNIVGGLGKELFFKK